MNVNSIYCFVIVSQKIVIIKNGGSLGISVVGGVGQTSHPFGINDPGIFVSKVGLVAAFFVCVDIGTADIVQVIVHFNRKRNL